MRFSSESSYAELTADKVYTSKMLAQNIVNNCMSASKKMCEKKFWGKIEPWEDLVAEIIWNLGSKGAHMRTCMAPVP